MERLINLVAALLHTDRPLTGEELRDRVPGYGESKAAFHRAFERDKDVLREMGVPIVTELIDPDQPGQLGYRIPKDEYYLRDPQLERDELAALHLAATAVQMEGASGLAALWKLGGAVERPDAGDGAVAALPGTAHLATLFGAISDRRVVTFTYRGQLRHVDPWRLSFRSGHWYLLGRDHGRGDQRSFRLDRFESDVDVADAANSFERPDATAGQPPAWQMGDEEPVTAHLLVDADQAGWAIAQLGDDAVARRRADGAVELSVHVTNRDAFRSFVLGFLDHAEVLGPEELRAQLVSWLTDLAASQAA